MNISENLYAHAKINLALIIGNKFPSSGFHSLESLFVRLSLSDKIIININSNKNNEPKISVSCQFDNRLENHIHSSQKSLVQIQKSIESEEGIIVRTIQKTNEALRSKLEGLSIDINLFKSIPLEAGLGGGSADAGAILNFFSRRFNLSDQAKFDIADQVGFDVAPCLFQGASYASYDGKHFVRPISFPKGSRRRYVLLLKPPQGSNTKIAYEALGREEFKDEERAYRKISIEDASLLLESIMLGSEGNGIRKLGLIENDFQASVFKEIPSLENVLALLSPFGPIVSGLSGSGSSIFSIFGDYKSALKAFKANTNLLEKGWFLSIEQILCV